MTKIGLAPVPAKTAQAPPERSPSIPKQQSYSAQQCAVSAISSTADLNWLESIVGAQRAG